MRARGAVAIPLGFVGEFASVRLRTFWRRPAQRGPDYPDYHRLHPITPTNGGRLPSANHFSCASPDPPGHANDENNTDWTVRGPVGCTSTSATATWRRHGGPAAGHTQAVSVALCGTIVPQSFVPVPLVLRMSVKEKHSPVRLCANHNEPTARLRCRRAFGALRAGPTCTPRLRRRPPQNIQVIRAWFFFRGFSWGLLKESPCTFHYNAGCPPRSGWCKFNPTRDPNCCSSRATVPTLVSYMAEGCC